MDRYSAARASVLSAGDAASFRQTFVWPTLPPTFNWAVDWLDGWAAQHPARAALTVAGEAPARLTYGELAAQSSQVANHMLARGVRKGDAAIVMLGNGSELFLVLLAAIKIGAVIVPTSTLLTEADLLDRATRSQAEHIFAGPAAEPVVTRVAARVRPRPCLHWVGPAQAAPAGWLAFDEFRAQPTDLRRPYATLLTDPLFIYFTSGTTSKPKMVLHSHASYPVGHLTTLYWLGLREDDVHLNISTTGWGKHVWSNFFAPLIAGCTVFINNQPGGRFDAPDMLAQIVKHRVTSLCCAPTVWRTFVQEDLRAYPVALRSICSAGEPLNPDVLRHVRACWNLTIREGYGQTETTCVMGNPPGHPVTEGSLGVPLPGYDVFVDGQPDVNEEVEGELCVRLTPQHPVGLMVGYHGDAERTAKAFADGVYRTGDVVRLTRRGVYLYIARTDDVFKSSGYRISPFELESALIECPHVIEAAVVPSPDPIKGLVPKAFVTLARHGPHEAPKDAVVHEVFNHCRERLPQYIRPRRIEFNLPLPKTASGKVQRGLLARLEKERFAVAGYSEFNRRPNELWESDVLPPPVVIEPMPNVAPAPSSAPAAKL